MWGNAYKVQTQILPIQTIKKNIIKIYVSLHTVVYQISHYATHTILLKLKLIHEK